MSHQSKTINKVAGAAIVAFTLLKMSAGKLISADAGDELLLVGIAQNTYAQDDNACAEPLNVGGVQKVLAGAAISAGQFLVLADDGKVAPYVPGSTGSRVIGQALGDASADTDPVTAYLFAQPTMAGQIAALNASEAIDAFDLVKLSSGEVAKAGASDASNIIGVAETAAAIDTEVTVRPKSGSVEVQVRAAGAISVGAYLKSAADGEVSAAGTTNAEVTIGEALEAATGANDVFRAHLYAVPITRDLS